MFKPSTVLKISANSDNNIKKENYVRDENSSEKYYQFELAELWRRYHYLSDKDKAMTTVTITNRPCKYCGKEDLIFDSRIKSKNGIIIPLNAADRRPHDHPELRGISFKKRKLLRLGMQSTPTPTIEPETETEEHF